MFPGDVQAALAAEWTSPVGGRSRGSLHCASLGLFLLFSVPLRRQRLQNRHNLLSWKYTIDLYGETRSALAGIWTPQISLPVDLV